MSEIIVDWGSTNFRAFLVKDGRIVDKCNNAGQGVLQLYQSVKDKQQFHDSAFRSRYFSDILKSGIRNWLNADSITEIYMCGAIGSREGWLDTGYTDAPANIEKLSRNVYFIKPGQSDICADIRIGILPGLAAQHSGRHDIMRSEEIKSLGALSSLGLENGIFCIPGTHCKWVRIVKHELISFHSALTGELYNVLQANGSLSSLLSLEQDNENDESFDQGLALAQQGQDLLADIWQVRAQAIRAKNPPSHLHSYLSGILIGHEIKHAMTVIKGLNEVILLSDFGARQRFYKRALEKNGLDVSHSIESEAAVCAGMLSLIKFCRQH